MLADTLGREAPAVSVPFAPAAQPRTPLRRAITAATRLPEAEALASLLQAATLPTALRAPIAATTVRLVEALRTGAKGASGDPAVARLVREFPLSQPEGQALMELAEALLRIPDDATRDALIRDKLARGDWAAHLGAGRPLRVRAAAAGLAVGGSLARAEDVRGPVAAVKRLLGVLSAPVARTCVGRAVARMGRQFVTGQTIAEALQRAVARESEGFLYSYDMLGEAAVTAADAARYAAAYEASLHAIGKVAAGRGIHAAPGLSIKLSALHPRYGRAQSERVMGELLPRIAHLARLAKGYDVGLNIDAEEQDRLEISLDLMEALCADSTLQGWNGLGFVVQAYGKRSPQVVDWLVDLARRSGRRIMVRLVKGAYWDTEIARAQQHGDEDFPVFTRKAHTDVCYIACARKLLAARDAVFPQFATHNAQTVATIFHLAGAQFSLGSYEFQCLHGLGEALYAHVVGAKGLQRPCRIYAPVGSHETLLAYLVRRLLENGANASFVRLVEDPSVPAATLALDPASLVRAEPHPGAPHPDLAAPRALFADRANSLGLDLSNEDVLARLDADLTACASRTFHAAPASGQGLAREVLNPADHRDRVGTVIEVDPAHVPAAVAGARAGARAWAQVSAAHRASCLRTAADEMQACMGAWMALLMREAGKSAANAVAEVREAIDFLRYYANGAEALRADQQGLGFMVCISPWNFPLAIFMGQVAAALAAGNGVLAKPAEETPLIAAEAVRLLHGAGVPADALQLFPGDGRVGAALVDVPEIAGVLFTGSTDVARIINGRLAGRLSPEGQPLVLIAETGGLNAMVVDSSALPEQVVNDVVASAFDSAGQRCSALRLLCLQEEVADPILDLLRGAMAELRVGATRQLSADVGPVISAAARDGIEAHVAEMARRGHRVFRAPVVEEGAHGTFVQPTLIEISRVEDLKQEVFGPVLHVVRYRRRDLERVLSAINAGGYGLTFGLETRLDRQMARATRQVRAGNLYINRNIIGAVVGVQPFGGCGLSGTGPKAGGPLYLQRLVQGAPDWPSLDAVGTTDAAALAFAGWLEKQGLDALSRRARAWAAAVPLGATAQLPGPVGERNVYRLLPRGRVYISAQTRSGLCMAIAAALATGNEAVVEAPQDTRFSPAMLRVMPRALAMRIRWGGLDNTGRAFDVALVEGDAEDLARVARRLAERAGPVVPVHGLPAEAQREATALSQVLPWLMREVCVSTNIAAAGGNASLVATL